MIEAIQGDISTIHQELRQATISLVGGTVAGPFLQIEKRIYTLKDLRLEREIPIIGR